MSGLCAGAWMKDCEAVAVSALVGAQCVCLVIYGAGPLFLASGHSPPPLLPQVGAGRLWGVFTWAGAGKAVSGVLQPPCPMRGASDCPTLGQIPTLPRGPDMEVHQPTRLAPGPFPLGIFSKPATFLWGFTHDPPHPQLGGSHCLLPPPPGKATPCVLCF